MAIFHAIAATISEISRLVVPEVLITNLAVFGLVDAGLKGRGTPSWSVAITIYGVAVTQVQHVLRSAGRGRVGQGLRRKIGVCCASLTETVAVGQALCPAVTFTRRSATDKKGRRRGPSAALAFSLAVVVD